ncbi:MAG: hypothetical protein KF724_00805 [Phycisphaeraceae bacterium]|nr:hypothetical protein [Phycisphaeraceae bacterium]
MFRPLASLTVLGSLGLTLGLSSGAAGAVLLPGDSVSLNGWTPAAGGSQIYSQDFSFTAIDVPNGANAATGVVRQTIETMTSGELLFGLRIIQLNADPGVFVSTMSMTRWGGFQVDTDFLLGSGNPAPGDAWRTANGVMVTWANFDQSLSDGKSSSWVQVLTNAVNFTPGISRLSLGFSDGSRADMSIAAPSAIPSPGPAVLLLGAVACAVRRRR